jgi:hypothetical protein
VVLNLASDDAENCTLTFRVVVTQGVRHRA